MICFSYRSQKLRQFVKDVIKSRKQLVVGRKSQTLAGKVWRPSQWNKTCCFVLFLLFLGEDSLHLREPCKSLRCMLAQEINLQHSAKI